MIQGPEAQDLQQQKIVDAIHQMVLEDRHLTIQQMADKMGISYISVQGVLVDTSKA